LFEYPLTLPFSTNNISSLIWHDCYLIQPHEECFTTTTGEKEEEEEEEEEEEDENRQVSFLI
jgi:hypothetical protein